MTATMMDIAKDLKVSVVTVSKVLRNQGRISEFKNSAAYNDAIREKLAKGRSGEELFFDLGV